MKYLLDTCVLLEIIKIKADENVISWMNNQDEDSLYLSVLTFGEIEQGIEKLTDENRKRKLQIWLEKDLRERFHDRIVPIDIDVAVRWGAVLARAELMGKPIPAIDGLIAVSWLVHNCIVVTRNVSDMKQSTVELLNPWEYGSS